MMNARITYQSLRAYLLQIAAIAVLVIAASGHAFAQSGMATGRFSLTVDNKEHVFSELGGLQSGAGTAAPGPGSKTAPPTVTLRRALETSGTLALQPWVQLARTGNPAARKNVTLTIFDAAGKPAQRYLLRNALPKQLVAAGGAAPLETLTLTCESIEPAR